jgi:hypothetical protein
MTETTEKKSKGVFMMTRINQRHYRYPAWCPLGWGNDWIGRFLNKSSRLPNFDMWRPVRLLDHWWRRTEAKQAWETKFGPSEKSIFYLRTYNVRPWDNESGQEEIETYEAPVDQYGETLFHRRVWVSSRAVVAKEYAPNSPIPFASIWRACPLGGWDRRRTEYLDGQDIYGKPLALKF